jgi:hypothetical protein
MNETEYVAELDQWLNDCRKAALALKTDGVVMEKCLSIAMQIANGQAERRVIERMKVREQLAGGRGSARIS